MVRVFDDGGIFFVWYDWKLWVIVMLWYYILMKCVDVIKMDVYVMRVFVYVMRVFVDVES